MSRQLLAPDRVMLLLSLIPYLREHGPTPVRQIAGAFDVAPDVLRGLVEFLATAGVPGETLSYQHEDLFDIDWDAFEREDVVSLTRVVAVDETPRFAPLETAALIAGLQSLTAVLPAEEAEVARATAEKLGGALGDPASPPPLSVSSDPSDPQLSVIIAALQQERALDFGYRSVAGDETNRTVEPLTLYESSGAWYVRAHCRDRQAVRVFRVDQMRAVRHAGPRRQVHDSRATQTGAAHTEIVAVLPVNRLALIADFAPEIISELADGLVRVRVASWHSGSAVRLVQQSRGSATVEEPPAARAAVRDWAERALTAYDTLRKGISLLNGYGGG